MSQEVAAVTAAKYVNEVTVDGVTRYQACVHGCSSEVRDTHHEAVKDARRMLQSATVTAVMKGYMPKLPAAAAYDISGAWIVAKAVRERGEVIAVDYFANPLNRSAKAIESWTGEDADEIIRGAMAGNVVRVESRGLAKPETRDLVAVIAPSREAAVMMARVKLGSAEEKLIEEMAGQPSSSPLLASTVARLKAELEAVAKERDALKSSLKEASECNRIGSERMLKMVEERDAAKRLHRETLGILGKVCGEMLAAAAAAGLSEEKRSGNAVECAKSLVSWVSDAVADGERASKYVARLGLDVGERYTLMMVVRAMVERIDELTAERDGDPQRARAERLAGIGRRLNQEKNDLEAERDAFALTIARLVSKN